MNDIDLMVPSSALESCVRQLTDFGYRPMKGVRLSPSHHHYLPLVHSSYPTRVELHRNPVENKFRSLLDTNTMWEKSKRIDKPNAVFRIPSLHHFVIHNIIHHQLSNNNFIKNGISLYQMLDVISARKNLDRQIDWWDIKTRFKNSGYERALLSYIVVGSRLFQLDVPDPLCSRTAAFILWFQFKIHLEHPELLRLEHVLIPYFMEIRKAFENENDRKSLIRKLVDFRVYSDNIRLIRNEMRKQKVQPLM